MQRSTMAVAVVVMGLALALLVPGLARADVLQVAELTSEIGRAHV